MASIQMLRNSAARHFFNPLEFFFFVTPSCSRAEIQGGNAFISCIPHTHCTHHFERLDAFTLCQHKKRRKEKTSHCYAFIIVSYLFRLFHLFLVEKCLMMNSKDLERCFQISLKTSRGLSPPQLPHTNTLRHTHIAVLILSSRLWNPLVWYSCYCPVPLPCHAHAFTFEGEVFLSGHKK